MSAQATSEHPSVAIMVNAAIGELRQKHGSSLAAIKKYILANYKGIEMVRAAPLIRRYLRKATTDGVVTQKKRSFSVTERPDEKPEAEKTAPTGKTAPAEKGRKAAAKQTKKTPERKALKKAPKKRSPLKKTAKVMLTPMKKPVAKKLAKKSSAKKSSKE